MKAAVLLEPSNLVIKEIDKPKAKKDEVLIKIMACGVCPTDVKKFSGISSLPKFPFILGHEVAGIIEEVGEYVDRDAFKVGDRVVLGPVINCGTCVNCMNGNLEKVGLGSCLNHKIIGVTVDGGFTEYISVPPKLVYKIPSHMKFNEAALVEPVADCLNGIEKAQVQTGDTVFIVGAGFMGLTLTILAKMRGARVIISDPLEERLEIAKSLGAYIAMNPSKEDIIGKIEDFTKGELIEAVICSIGGAQVVEQGISLLNHGGRIVLLGGTYPPQNASIDINEVHYKQLVIIGSVSYTKSSFYKTIKIISNGQMPTEILQDDLLPLEDLEKAFKDVLGTKGLRKCVMFD